MTTDLNRERTSRTRLGAVAAGGVLLLQLVACASATTMQTDSGSCSAVIDYQREDIFTSSGIAQLSSRALAYFAFGYDSAASRQRRSQGYVIVVRGQPGWYRVGGPTQAGGPAHGSERRVHVWEAGGRKLTTLFEPTARVVELLSARVALDTANVIFVDRIDGVGGPAVVRGTACAARLRVNDSARDLLDSVPGLRAYASGAGGA
jgi:hypothetical protein